MEKVLLIHAMALLFGFFMALPCSGDITVYESGTKFVKVGGAIQLQYHITDPEDGESEDELFFRRLQPVIEAGLHEDWTGKIGWDMGKAKNENEVELNDVYLQYKGFTDMAVTLGNFYVPFSREILTSNKKQQLVEYTFAGDHNYGVPGRATGLQVSGHVLEKKIEMAAAMVQACMDPDRKKLDFEPPVNGEDDFNEGWMGVARVDFHPFGNLKMAQGDFDRKFKATMGIAGFVWNNDDDNNTYTENGLDISTDHKKPDVDSATGFEVSGAIRGAGFSMDAQYNLFKAETVDSSLSGGIYENGEADLSNLSLEGGYMILPGLLEVVAGYEFQDADGYDEKWTRTSFGLNYFFKEHDIKIQGAYRMGKNLDGTDDNDADETFIQAQYVF